MKIMVVGATGIIGTAVCDLLGSDHDLVKVGHTGGDYQVDLSSKPSIEALYEAVGPIDGVICAAGLADFGALADLDDAAFDLAVTNKLMGQVNLARIGAKVLDAKGGSITLSGGMLSRRPWPGTSAISMVNGALESFVRAAALDLPPGVRINVVAPAFVKETMEKMGLDPASGLSAAVTAKAYKDALEGEETGKTLNATDYR